MRWACLLLGLIGCGTSGGMTPDAGAPDLRGSVVVVISQNAMTPPCVPQGIANPDQQCSIVLANSEGTLTTLPRCESSPSPPYPCGSISNLSACGSGKEFIVNFGGMAPPPGMTAEGVCTP